MSKKAPHSNTKLSLRVHNKENNINISTTNQFAANIPSAVQTIYLYYTYSKAHRTNAVLNIDIGLMEEYRQLCKGKDKIIWQRSFSNELGHLAQGMQTIIGIDCITFILYSQIPKDKKVAYTCIVCSMYPQKKEINQPHMTIGVIY